MAAGAAPADLRIEQVSKRFGSYQALDRISLEVEQGEFIALLGPSGCGKTTLLRTIAGLEPVSAGRILQAGTDVTALPPGQRDFGIVFQSYALFPNLTAAENIGYGLRGREWPAVRAAARVAAMLELVGLADQAGQYPAQLSGGQQQRVALARALANQPGLLLLDEPLSALDAIVRVRLRQEIRALQRRLGVTTVMVTHDQEEALSVADRVVVMAAGRIEQIGTPEAIYRHPASAFVAGFVGQSSWFAGRIAAPGEVRLTGGLALAAAAAGAHPVGAAVQLCIRPEHVRLAVPGGLPARVTALEYLGPVCRLTLALGELTLTADATPDSLSALGLGPGEPIAIGLPADRLLVFAADG